MITVTRLNSQPITINALMIESIEQTPDTLIVMTTGKRITVREKAKDVVELVKEYMKSVNYIRLNFSDDQTDTDMK
jgi:flagellar protein FlbD